PFTHSAWEQRMAYAASLPSPVVFANLVGGSDALIFDGRSFVLDGENGVVLPGFEEAVRVIDLNDLPKFSPPTDDISTVKNALVLGLRDFAQKNSIQHAFLGLSGGIDSSVVAALAAEALSPVDVTGIAMPSRHTDPRSTQAAEKLAANLGIGFALTPIEPLHTAAQAAQPELFGEGVGAENVQARLRMVILMGYVNNFGGMLLNTGNKTEAAVGYATLYGDTAGTLCPIADLTKPEVYELARHINAEKEVIPQFALERAPSAELHPGQVDPFDYDEISPKLEELVLHNQSNPAMRAAEHKRAQSGVVLKVSEKAFGSGRMIPITRK
ncbi:MAG TPA: NAD(+) synthase, partial [Anaerolineales bacterium]|nr:NAD(+) synthase [Anaerolineales bacterium]